MIGCLFYFGHIYKKNFYVLAINNPNIQNVSAHAHTDKTAACFKNNFYSTVSFIALSLIIAESAFSFIFFLLFLCFHLVLLLRDTAFHLNNFWPAFILVCVLVILYMLFKWTFGLNSFSTTEDPIVSEAKVSNGCAS